MSHMLPGPGYYNDEAVRGNTLFRQYECQAADGTPVDLTGFRARWRGVYGDVTVVKDTAEDTLLLTSPSNGTIGLILSPVETRLIPLDESMKYELEIIGPDGSELTVLWGDMVGKGGWNTE